MYGYCASSVLRTVSLTASNILMARLDCINGFNGLSCQRGCRLDCYLSMHGSRTPYYRRHACLHEHRLRTFSRRVGMLGVLCILPRNHWCITRDLSMCSFHFVPAFNHTNIHQNPEYYAFVLGTVRFSVRRPPESKPPSKSAALRKRR